MAQSEGSLKGTKILGISDPKLLTCGKSFFFKRENAVSLYKAVNVTIYMQTWQFKA